MEIPTLQEWTWGHNTGAEYAQREAFQFHAAAAGHFQTATKSSTDPYDVTIVVPMLARAALMIDTVLIYPWCDLKKDSCGKQKVNQISSSLPQLLGSKPLCFWWVVLNSVGLCLFENLLPNATGGPSGYLSLPEAGCFFPRGVCDLL